MLLRLILFLFLLSAAALAFASVMVALRSTATLAHETVGDSMPKALKTLAYGALLILMFGVVTGWLGAA